MHTRVSAEAFRAASATAEVCAGIARVHGGLLQRHEQADQKAVRTQSAGCTNKTVPTAGCGPGMARPGMGLVGTPTRQSRSGTLLSSGGWPADGRLLVGADGDVQELPRHRATTQDSMAV